MFALTHCKILPILSLSLILFFIIQFSSVRQTTFPPLMWCINYDKLAHPVYKLKFETTNMRLCLLVNAYLESIDWILLCILCNLTFWMTSLYAFSTRTYGIITENNLHCFVVIKRREPSRYSFILRIYWRPYTGTMSVAHRNTIIHGRFETTSQN